MPRFPRFLFPAIWTSLLLLGAFFWVREEAVSRIYREKLDSLSTDYANLARHYNHAVRQSALTELEVTPDSVDVLIRTIDGDIRRIPTPFDPQGEIYLDYLVGNGRIWMRRIFDASTPPAEGLLIDPLWNEVDWPRAGMQYGKAIYRSLEPGIWSIQVSGNGALSLLPVDRSRLQYLEANPQIRSYEEIQTEIDQEIREIGFADIKTLWSSFRQ